MPDAPLTLVLKPAPEAVREAREFVALAVDGLGFPGLVETARLVVSELATNAIGHGSAAGDSVVVRVLTGPGSLTIELWDRADDLPVVRPAAPDAEDGRGLHLVSLLCSAWGVRPLTEGGKVVHATLLVGE